MWNKAENVSFNPKLRFALDTHMKCPFCFLPASLIWSEKYYSQLSKIGSENFSIMSNELLNHLPTWYSSTVSFKNIFEMFHFCWRYGILWGMELLWFSCTLKLQKFWEFKWISNNFLDKHVEVTFKPSIECFLVLLSGLHILHILFALEHSSVLLVRYRLVAISFPELEISSDIPTQGFLSL